MACKMDDFEALEADFAAPFFEIGSGIMPGATSHECIETIDGWLVVTRIGRGECKLVKRNVRNVRPITWVARLIPVGSFFQNEIFRFDCFHSPVAGNLR